jgi:hypothetical protein
LKKHDLRLKLAPELVDVFGAVVHPIIGLEHLAMVIVGSSLIMKHHRFNSAQNAKEYLIREILVLDDLLFILLCIFLTACMIIVVVIEVVAHAC